MAKFQEGVALAKAGKCKEALVAFDEAYRLKPGGGLLRKIAACRETVGDLAGTREALAKYLEDPAAPERDLVAKDLARIDDRVAQEKAALEAQEKAALEAQEKAALEAQEKAAREAQEKLAREKAAQEAQELAAREAQPPSPSPTPPPLSILSPPGAVVPSIDHRPLTQVVRGDTPTIRAKVTTPPNRKLTPQARVRPSGIEGFVTFRLDPDPAFPELFSGQLAPSFSGEGFDYYVELLDERAEAVARVGSPSEPIRVGPGLLPLVPHAGEGLAAAEVKGPGPGRALRTVAVVTGILSGAALAAGGYLQFDARMRISRYQEGLGPNQGQDVGYEEAQMISEESKLGAGLLAGGAVVGAFSFFLAF